MRQKGRWPAYVYILGEEPDYRFSFANERTYLAWIRTALALIAAGVALDVVDLSIGEWLQKLAAIVLVTLGLACAVAASVRWAMSERAIRAGKPLPSFGYSALGSIGLVAIGLAASIAILRG